MAQDPSSRPEASRLAGWLPIVLGLVVLAALVPVMQRCAPKAGQEPGREGNAAASAPGMVVHRKNAAGRPAEGGMVRADSKAGGFSVLLPGAFDDFSLQTQAADGTPARVEALRCKAGGAVLSALRLARADGAAFGPEVLEKLAKNAAERTRVREHHALARGQDPGLDLVFEDKGVVVYLRSYLIGGKLYQLTAQFPEGQRPTDVDRFLESLEVERP